MPDQHQNKPAGGIDCREAMARLWDFLDGELDATLEASMREHLTACGPCLEHHEFERAFLTAVSRSKQSAPAPQGLRARVEQTLRDRGLLA